MLQLEPAWSCRCLLTVVVGVGLVHSCCSRRCRLHTCHARLFTSLFYGSIIPPQRPVPRIALLRALRDDAIDRAFCRDQAVTSESGGRAGRTQCRCIVTRRSLHVAATKPALGVPRARLAGWRHPAPHPSEDDSVNLMAAINVRFCGITFDVHLLGCTVRVNVVVRIQRVPK